MATDPEVTQAGNTVTVSPGESADSGTFQDIRNVLSRQMAQEKQEWPELVGTDAQAAKATLQQTTGKTVYLVEQGIMVTMDFRADRIRIFYNKETGKVIRTPRIG